MSSSRSPAPTGQSTSNLVFSVDPTLENVYLVYTAEKNRGLTIRLHTMLTLAWIVAILKTGSQVADTNRDNKAFSPQAGFLLTVQAINLALQIVALRKFFSLSRPDQLTQERSKAWLLVSLQLAVAGSVVLSDQDLPHAPNPTTALIISSFLAVVNMLRLDTILQLQKLNWLVFALLELDRSRRASGVTPKTLAGDVATAIALGGVVPIVIAIVAELYQRESFLRDCKKPMNALGPFWLGVKQFMAQVIGADAIHEQDLHME